MSYADVAARGPKQTAEEQARAPAMPEIEKTDDSVSSLVDVDSPHISSVPSDFESQPVKTETQADRIELEDRTREAVAEAKEEAKRAKDKAKAKASRGNDYVRENAQNPVLIGNALTVGILGTVIGVGAYRKYVRDELSWKVVGAWAGVVGLFAAGDYYVSQYLFKKYPTKK
ncbi:hypothetical protein K504DRAFT_423719 [Pleomassaria siparia CBS 279.74]|uniref:Uncharacterized protein n=1 Tax=Pleomassaria siparia CBS 279.74 TaxID=1314801 RepID=A0A6G1KLI3_9PLEO|nr:hypothetical protein K504DRAFT_423719 [Pleomassaria siparia CBS 279.74]